MNQKESENNQSDEELEDKDEYPDMDDQPDIEIDPHKIEKTRTELKVLKEFLKKQQSQKNITNQKERRQ